MIKKREIYEYANAPVTVKVLWLSYSTWNMPVIGEPPDPFKICTVDGPANAKLTVTEPAKAL